MADQVLAKSEGVIGGLVQEAGMDLLRRGIEEFKPIDSTAPRNPQRSDGPNAALTLQDEDADRSRTERFQERQNVIDIEENAAGGLREVLPIRSDRRQLSLRC